MCLCEGGGGCWCDGSMATSPDRTLVSRVSTSATCPRSHLHTHLPTAVTALHPAAKGLVWTKEAEVAAKQGFRMFFIRVLPVAPNKFRPPSKVGEEM